MRSVKGAVAVITGAGSGIGRATAIELAGRGTALALADLNERGLQETLALLPPGTDAIVRAVDVSKPEQMDGFADDVRGHFGRASILMNNAGVGLYGRFDEVSREDLHWIMNINFWGAVYGTQAFMPLLRAEPAANIVTISSIYGIIAPPGNLGYSASKFAVRGFFEALRHELRGTPLKVTVVHPGGIKTNIATMSRLGAKADAAAQLRDTERFTSLLRKPPAEAALMIVRAIERDAPRLLIGSDARLLDTVQRLAPAAYAGVLERLFPAAAPRTADMAVTADVTVGGSAADVTVGGSAAGPSTASRNGAGVGIASV